MHSRHRSPGSGGGGGYNRSSSFGGRMPPPHKQYMNPPPPPPPVPLPPPKGDVLMEAGRMAAEYLVGQGVLPPYVLSEKWPSGGFKNNQIVEFQMAAAEGRTSALSRLGNGNGVSDTGFRDRFRGRRRMGYDRGYGADWGRDNRRSNSIEGEEDLVYGQLRREEERQGNFEFSGGGGGLKDAGNGGSSRSDVAGDSESVHGQLSREEQRQGNFDVSSGGGGMKDVGNDLPLSRSDAAGESESVPPRNEFFKGAGSTTSTCTGEEISMVTDHEASNTVDEVKISNAEIGEVKDCTSNEVLEKQTVLEDFSIHHQPMESDDIKSKNGNDLLSLCDFSNVPTRTRSSLTPKDSKVETIPMDKEDTTSDVDIPPGEGPRGAKEEGPSECLSSFMLVNQPQDSKGLDSDVSEAPSIQSGDNVGVLGSTFAVEKVESVTQPLLNRAVIAEQASGQGLLELGRCDSAVKDRGDKRVLEDDDAREGSKKLREWPSTLVASSDEFFHLHNFSANPSHSHQSTTPDMEGLGVVDEERFFDVSLLPRGGIEFKEEKQLFPSSFKICDLNLMESSDMNETYPSTMEAKKGVQVDVDLSMSNNCSRVEDCNKSAADAIEAQMVEVEDDPVKEDDGFDTQEKKTEVPQLSLESFPNHMDSTGDLPSTNDLPDAQDGYGLMISELLGNDISNCSSVPADMTSMHTEMGLHNGEEMIGDDDPIYLSLGEIPISFLGVWEQQQQQQQQQPQSYQKPF